MLPGKPLFPITEETMATAIVAHVEYREIPDHKGYYAGTDGSIWSTWTKGRRSTPGGEPRRLKGSPHVRSGHLYLTMRTDSRFKVGIHQLILETFVGPAPHGMECRHLNGNPADNRLQNLAWGTRRENVADSIKHGTFRGSNRRRAGTAKGSDPPKLAASAISF